MINDLPKIHCTTNVIIRNTKTKKIYKDEADKVLEAAPSFNLNI